MRKNFKSDIASTLNNIPAYWLQLFRAPKNIIKQIDRTRRDFFWNEINESSCHSKKLHSIGWHKIILPKDLGGLGLANLNLKNLALLSKWWWKIRQDRKCMWHKVLIGKYGNVLSDVEGAGVLNSKKYSPVMLSLMHASRDPCFSILFPDSSKWIVKDGSSIVFWQDLWHGSGVLASRFSILYGLARDKQCTLQEMKSKWHSSMAESGLWNRPLSTQEKQEALNLKVILDSVILGIEKDILTWGPLIGKFKTSVCYRGMISSNGFIGPWKLIWKLKIPHKVKLLLWQLAHASLPTLLFLLKKKIITNAVCKWCGIEEESTVHLFWQCPLAKTAWQFTSKWLEITINGFESYNLEDSLRRLAHNKFRIGGGLCVAALFWTIWLARNELIFRNHRMSSDALKSLIMTSSFRWGVANKLILPHQQNVWSLNPNHLLAVNSRVAKRKLVSYWSEVSPIVGFIDGAWKKPGPGSSQAGIGGFLITKLHSLKFIFSGPSSNVSPYETELEAFMFLLSHIADSSLNNERIVIFSDSISLVNNLHSLRSEMSPFNYNASSIFHMVHLVHIDRMLNTEADRLAKEGLARLKMIAAWV